MSIVGMVMNGATNYRILKKYCLTPRGLQWVRSRVFEIVYLPEGRAKSERQYLNSIFERELTR